MTATRARAAAAVLAMLLLAACGDDDGSGGSDGAAETTVVSEDGDDGGGSPADVAGAPELPFDVTERNEFIEAQGEALCDAVSADDVLAATGSEVDFGEPDHIFINRGDIDFQAAACQFEVRATDGEISIATLYPDAGDTFGVAEVQAMMDEALDDPFDEAEEVDGVGEVAFAADTFFGQELFAAADGVAILVQADLGEESMPVDQLVELAELTLAAAG